jgi:DNA-binding NarL/FixJ family response regulator
MGVRGEVNGSSEPKIDGSARIRVLLVGMDGGGVLQVLTVDPRFEVREAPSLPRGRDALASLRPDVIVVAFTEPTPNDISELRSLRAAYRAPILVVSRPVDEQRVTWMIKAGAGGYLLTQDLQRVPDAVAELFRGGVPMSRSVSQLVLGRARRSSAKMAAVRADSTLADELITPRQHEILKMLAHGHSYEAIALALSLSINTVRSHVRALYERLGASTKVEAVLAAIELRLLDRDSSR